MANIKVFKSVVMLETEIKKEDYEAIKLQCPEALIIKDDEGNHQFRIGAAFEDAGSITDSGVVFDEWNPEDKHMYVVVINSSRRESLDKQREYVRRHYARTLAMLEQIEKQVKEATGMLEENYRECEDRIEFVS